MAIAITSSLAIRAQPTSTKEYPLRVSNYFALTLLLLTAAAANAQVPAAPQVTLGADLKLLRFDWEPVPRATFYRLWVKPGGTRYISVGDRIPASITRAEYAIPVHLQDWTRTRYVVTACNASGCSHSAALNPSSVMLDAIGYVKASNTGSDDFFGSSLALSKDGYTLAVSAVGEDSDASGVNGDQSNDNSPHSGAVYVFRRRGNTWHQEAYIKASVNQPAQVFGNGLALSADGSLLVATASQENVDGLDAAGAVYIYRRVQNVWSPMTRLEAPQPQRHDFFGSFPEISDDGLTLKVNALGPFRLPELADDPVYRTHTYVRAGNTWQTFRTVAPFYPGDSCPSTRMSGDGQTLVSSCVNTSTETRVVTMKRSSDTWVHASTMATDFLVLSNAIALNPDATVMALKQGDTGDTTDSVGVYRWAGGAWVGETEFPAPVGSSIWGVTLALSDNGRLLAVGDPDGFQSGAGISPVPMPGSARIGAIFLYQRNESAGSWTLRNVVKSPNPDYSDLFGIAMALSASGRTLAVGAFGEDSSATGIDGDRQDEGLIESGAAYLY